MDQNLKCPNCAADVAIPSGSDLVRCGYCKTAYELTLRPDGTRSLVRLDTAKPTEVGESGPRKGAGTPSSAAVSEPQAKQSGDSDTAKRNESERRPAILRILLLVSGIVVGGLLLWFLAIAPMMAEAAEKARSISCYNNLRQIGLAAQQWALAGRRKTPTFDKRLLLFRS
jgi:hypothetical protein